jgi:limonene 1,2-monooxygenase
MSAAVPSSNNSSGPRDYMRFGAFLAPYAPLRGSLSIQLRRHIDLAEHLDHLGYDEVWYGEHHSCGLEIIPAPDVAMAAAAERTTQIKFGTGVASLPYHHPMITLDRLMQLDHQSRGRVIIGTGPGKLALDAYMMGVDPERQRPMQAEALEAMVKLLAGEAVTMKTDWFEMNDARLQILPYNPEGIELAAASIVSPSGSVLCGRLGASLLSMAAATPDGYKQLATNWEIYTNTALEHGHVPDRRRWRLVAPMFIAETEEEARSAVRRRVLEIARYIEKQFAKTLPWAQSADAAIEQFVSPDGFPGFGRAVIGTPDQAIALIEDMLQTTGGFGTFLINAMDIMSWEHTQRSFELIALEVMPHFQGTNRGRDASDRFMTENVEWLGENLQKGVKHAIATYYGSTPQEQGSPS